MTKSATRIQDKDTQKRLSVVQSIDDPTKYGIVILNPDGTPIIGGGGGGGNMRKSMYDPTLVEGDAFDYRNFHHTPEVKTFELTGLTDYTTMQEALNYYISGGLAIVMYGGVAYKHSSMSVLYSDVPRVFSASTITVKMLICELSGTTVTRIDNPTMDFNKTVVEDNLTTQSSTSALSAKQGYVLEGEISSNTTDISTINSKIPSAATSSNQLADKDYVNDGINSVTAYYITKNAQGDQWSTRAELFAATTFYSGGVVRVPTKNDYTIVLADEQHDNACTRYIYNSGWEYQYTVNETALTQAQLNAINSGITSAKVSSYDGYATSKQDTLVSGTNIKTINNTSLLGSGNISISGDAKVFTYPSVGSNVSDLRNWAWFNHKTAFLNTTGTLQYVDNYVVTQCVEYGLGGGYNEIYATNGTSIVKIEVDGDTNTVVSITTTPTGGLQVSPNSTITGIKYVWYGTEADYAGLSQYYTDQPGDTEFHTF